ncbi:MAG TPA: acetyl-CoA carboxylase carboxyltransferase subunit beta, partial [Methylomirabilota bacterium]|nr:acetyl-CoA carboxylase carboxyltransferase subunit beta [Methylomirabilota bacterium]
MAWFWKKKEEGDEDRPKKVVIAEGLWVKCDSCREIVYRAEVERAGRVCPKCGYPFRISARERIAFIADEGSFEEREAGLRSKDPLAFKDTKRYTDRLKAARAKSSMEEAVVTGTARIGGYPVAIAVFEFAFLGGSMASVVGEKLTRTIELALQKRLPLLIISASGGARM